MSLSMRRGLSPSPSFFSTHASLGRTAVQVLPLYRVERGTRILWEPNTAGLFCVFGDGRGVVSRALGV